jgi:AraC family transcriptional regulator
MLFSSMGMPEPVKSFEMDGFLLTERFHPPNWVLPKHCHEAAIIGFILGGSLTEFADNRSYECAPFDLQVLPAGEDHSYKFGQARVHCITIEVKPQRLERVRLFSDVLDRVRFFNGAMLSTLLSRLYKEFRMGDSASVLTVEGLVLETLGAAAQSPRCASAAQPRWLGEARDFIHTHFAEAVSLTGLALLVEVHPAHLARMFRKHYGCSVGDYVRRLRLDYSVKQLATDRPLAEIASAAGFYDQSHFTHAFKLEMGMTPAAYRAATRTRRR